MTLPPSDQIGLRRATPNDTAAISQVICDAIRTVNAQDYPPAEIDRLIAGFSPTSLRGLMTERLTLVATQDNTIVGTGALRDAEIKSVFVSPQHHRRGIGTALMGALETIAMERGVRCLSLSSSLSAMGFYRMLGYEERQRSFYGVEETALMIKKFPCLEPW